MKFTAISISIFLCLAILVTGCTLQNTPLDPLNYTTYVNKEITLVLNNMESCMSNATLVSESNAMTELSNVDQSLVLIQEAIDSVTALSAPEGYVNDQLMVIQRMQECYDSLAEYRSILEAGNLTQVDLCVDDMQMAFTALNALFNNPNN